MFSSTDFPGTVQDFAEARIYQRFKNDQNTVFQYISPPWSNFNFCNFTLDLAEVSKTALKRRQNLAQQCLARDKYNGGSLTFKLISNSIFRDMKKCLFLGQSHFSKVLDMQASEHNSMYELAYVCILSKSSVWNYKYKLRYK